MVAGLYIYSSLYRYESCRAGQVTIWPDWLSSEWWPLSCLSTNGALYCKMRGQVSLRKIFFASAYYRHFLYKVSRPTVSRKVSQGRQASLLDVLDFITCLGYHRVSAISPQTVTDGVCVQSNDSSMHMVVIERQCYTRTDFAEFVTGHDIAEEPHSSTLRNTGQVICPFKLF